MAPPNPNLTRDGLLFVVELFAFFILYAVGKDFNLGPRYWGLLVALQLILLAYEFLRFAWTEFPNYPRRYKHCRSTWFAISSLILFNVVLERLTGPEAFRLSPTVSLVLGSTPLCVVAIFFYVGTTFHRVEELFPDDPAVESLSSECVNKLNI